MSASFYLPTVDIAPFLRDPGSAASAAIVDDVAAACRSTGFFQITGHGIAPELRAAIFAAAAAFFRLPFEEKKKLDARTTVGHRGYDVLASQSYEADVLPDLKEGYYIGTDLPSDAPLVQARRFFMGPNVWPPAELLPAPAFRRPAEAYYEAVYALALAVLALIARTLPYGPDVFAAFTAGTPAAPLRLLHYPPAPPPSSAAGPRQLGASAHTDFGAITLLLQDEHAGLEVRDPATGAWVEIPPGGDGYVVNVGDMLRAWTGGAYRSSVHRVINKEPTDRYSVVFFFDGNLDCPLAPLDGGPVDGDVVTVEGHMLRRMAESYGGAKGKRP